MAPSKQSAHAGTDQAIDDLLQLYPPEVRELALATRAFLLRLIPKAIETVDVKSKVIGIGFGTGYKDLICTLILAKGWVTLGIARGAGLPDPDKLLEGSGKVHRHVKLKSESDLKSPALAALVKASLANWKSKRESAGNRA
jgi:hypothetical protein